MGIKKTKAGALQFVLFIGSVIAVLLLSFVLVSHTHNLFQKKTDITINVIKFTDMALEASFNQLMNDGASTSISIDNTLDISASVSKEFWGMLELRRATAKKGAIAFEKLAFVGGTDDNRPALYIKDNQRPLVLAGNTKITGTAYLPEQGVKMGNIYGHSYYASQLIFGEEKRSSTELPKLASELQNQFSSLAGNRFSPKGEQIKPKKGSLIKNSFKNPTQLIQGSHLVLEDITLTGNVLVWASQKIVVRPSANLSDVILIAPRVEISNWTKGNFQVFASETIRVGKGTALGYPSFLGVWSTKKDSLAQQSIEPHIYLDSYADVRGLVVFHDENKQNRFRPHIKIDEHAKVYGEVYSAQNVELKGSVFGSLTTSGFVALENGNIYQNHIYNGRINSEVLPQEYAGLRYGNANPDQIIKWGY